MEVTNGAFQGVSVLIPAHNEADWLPAMRDFAIDFLMAEIREDLKSLGVDQSVFSSERALVTEGAVQRAFDALVAGGRYCLSMLPYTRGDLLHCLWCPRELFE